LKNNHWKWLMPSGGKRPGAGRKKGIPNKVTQELGTAAREYTEEALRALVRVMRKEDASDSAVIAAAKGILERGHGMPTQHVDAHVDLIDRLAHEDRVALEAALVALTSRQESRE
jgi:hypothetical protein